MDETWGMLVGRHSTGSDVGSGNAHLSAPSRYAALTDGWFAIPLVEDSGHGAGS